MSSSSHGSRLPHPITEKSPVLVSHIPLPTLPSIAYAKFVPIQQQEHQYKAIELARQRIINGVRRRGQSIEESLLPIVHIGKEEAALWVFSIRSLAHNQERSAGGKGQQKIDNFSVFGGLDDLALDNLQRCDLSQFTPSALYPCSLECAKLSDPCPCCTSMLSSDSIVHGDTFPSSSISIFFPRISLRVIYTLFIDAVRDRLIDDICIGPHHPQEEHTIATHLQGLERSSGATRLGRGFLTNSDPVFPTWGYGWEQRSHARPLIHTSLDIYVSLAAIHIRPLPTLTRLIPVPVGATPSSRPKSNSPSDSMLSPPPLTPGTPLVLAPHSTPAFYVSTHAGTSIPHSLRSQFWDALLGLGVFFLPDDSKCHSTSPLPTISASLLLMDSFVLALIPLLNPQGEPKVVPALWPTRLSFIDTGTNRFHLSSLPEMPGMEILLTPPRGAGAQPSDQPLRPTSPLPLFRRRSCVLPSLESLSRTQRIFRALELTSHKRVAEVQLLGTAKTTAGYVESVAKERERERERAIQERIRREREAKEGKSSSSALVPSTASSNTAKITTATASDAVIADSGSPKAIVDTTRSGSSWHSVPTNFFAKAAQDSVVHSFYPSPPDWNPVSCSQNSGTLDSAGNIAVSASSSTIHITHPTLHPQSGSTTNQQGLRESLDLSSEIDLGMDIDMNDMSMGINLGNTMGMLDVNMDVNMDAAGLMDGGFGSLTDAFTDDDFNYFDTAPAPEPIPIAQDIQRPLQHMSAAEGAVGGWLGNGLGAGDHGSGVLISSQLQPVTPASADATQESLAGLHQMLEDDRELLPPAPDLIPSSPAKTPLSPGSPPTPSLELTAPPAPPVGKRLFEPIYFGNRHHVADGKYRHARGKFAFPTTLPRSNSQTDFSPGILDNPHLFKGDGWKIRYDAITDPRVGVINRLRGVKRKFHGKAYSSKCVNGRLRDEEWESVYDHTEDAELPEISSSEEEDDIEEVELEQYQADDSSPQSHPSRPSTPPPSGLPLMATLLYFHFHHTHLLPLGVPMRPSYGELVSDNHPPPVPISVPTPVSPAAALGNATERNKSLELLAQTIAREAVENHVWAQAWGASLEGPLVPQTLRICRGVSPTDMKHIAHLLELVPGIRGPSCMSDILENSYSTSTTPIPNNPSRCKKLQLLQLPRISIGRAGFVHQMLPTAIRFWEKEGLGPRSGTKDVVAFALFEESDDRVALVEAWLERAGRVYAARGFGSHTVGNAGSYKCGLVPVQFDTVRKTLPNLMSALPEEPRHIVIYIIAPPTVFSSLKSPALRAILTQKGASKPDGHVFDQDRVLIHLVPDYCIADPFTYPSTRHVGLEWLVNSVYDRLLRATIRQTSRQFWELNPPFERRFQVPSFTLARNTVPESQFEWDEHPSLNVLDRHTFLHVGYRLSNCKRWLLAACIDERGEASDVAVWGVPHQNDSHAAVNWIVSNTWTFAKQFAQRADSEWRVVISKLGEIGESEVEVWMSHLESVLSTHTGSPLYICLVCAQNDIPLPILHSSVSINKKQSNAVSQSSSVFSDVSSATYSALFLQRTPIISPGLLCPWEYPSLVAPTGSGEDEVDPLPSTGSSASILPLSTTALLCVPSSNTEHTNVEALYIHLLCEYKSIKSTLRQTTREVHAEITRNWYDLAVLTRDRWHLSQRVELPFHLAALESMSKALDPSILTPDAKDIDCLFGS